MFEISAREFDLPSIMDSGQAFRIRQLGNGEFLVVAGNRAVTIRQETAARQEIAVGGGPERNAPKTGKWGKSEEVRLLFSCSRATFEEFWRDYFDLERDYGAIRRSIDPSDTFLLEAAEYGRGIRILHQDLWETIVSFLISQNNNILRIRRSIEALCRRYGKKIEISAAEGKSCYSFPIPEAIAEGGLDGLQGLGLGYRDKYILKMARRCSEKEGKAWLKQLERSSYEETRRLLTAEFGIGKKVADCVCLFALGHVEAFPVDTHIRQILETHYPEGFPFGRYEGYAGILQQYLFFAELKKEKKKGSKSAGA